MVVTAHCIINRKHLPSGHKRFFWVTHEANGLRNYIRFECNNDAISALVWVGQYFAKKVSKASLVNNI